METTTLDFELWQIKDAIKCKIGYKDLWNGKFPPTEAMKSKSENNRKHTQPFGKV